jgi:hypothetical protein
MSTGSIIREPYEIDLLEAYNCIKNILEDENDPPVLKISDTHKYLQKLLKLIYVICKGKKIDIVDYFERDQPIIINQEDKHEIYFKALGIMLIAYPTDIIPLFLAAQLERYKGRGNFVLAIQHYVRDFVEKESPFKNKERLDIIISWVTLNKVLNKKEKLKNQEPPLKWKNQEPDKFKQLSKKIYKAQYTKTPLSLYNAIHKGKITDWLKYPEVLAYLMNQLYNNSFIEPIYESGYMKATESLFCAVAQECAENFDFKINIDRINRSRKKYSKQRVFVDNLIQFLKNK